MSAITISWSFANRGTVLLCFWIKIYDVYLRELDRNNVEREYLCEEILLFELPLLCVTVASVWLMSWKKKRLVHWEYLLKFYQAQSSKSCLFHRCVFLHLLIKRKCSCQSHDGKLLWSITDCFNEKNEPKSVLSRLASLWHVCDTCCYRQCGEIISTRFLHYVLSQVCGLTWICGVHGGK